MVDQFDVIGVHVSYVSHDFLAVLTLPIFLNECSFEVSYHTLKQAQLLKENNLNVQMAMQRKVSKSC